MNVLRAMKLHYKADINYKIGSAVINSSYYNNIGVAKR